MKKTLCVIACLALLLGVLTSCGKEPPITSFEETSAPASAHKTEEPEISVSSEKSTLQETVRDTAETEPVTEEETQAQEIPVSPVYVYDAVNYSKVAVSKVEGLDFDWTHEIHVPALSGNSDAILAFNNKILQEYLPYKVTLEEDAEDVGVYHVDYDVYKNSGLFGIVVHLTRGVQFSEYNTVHRFYYFDTVSDRELTKTEYLALLDTSLEELDPIIRQTPEFLESESEHIEMFGEFEVTLLSVVFDENSFFAAYDNPEGEFDPVVIISSEW